MDAISVSTDEDGNHAIVSNRGVLFCFVRPTEEEAIQAARDALSEVRDALAKRLRDLSAA